MKTRHPTISATELDVLKALWEQGPGTVRDLEEPLRRRGRDWAYTTVQTLLTRLQAKGFVTSDKKGAAHVFRAAVSRDKLVRERLNDLANQLCGGTATPLLLALVEEHQFSKEEIQEFRRLLDDLETEQRRAK